RPPPNKYRLHDSIPRQEARALVPGSLPAEPIFPSLFEDCMTTKSSLRIALLLVAGTLFRANCQRADVKPLLAKIRAVGRQGEGNVEAARAWRQLTSHGPDVLLDILASRDDADPAAANWLRSAVEAITDRTLAAGKKLPAGPLEAFVRDTRRAGPARRLAFDCLARVDKTAP